MRTRRMHAATSGVWVAMGLACAALTPTAVEPLRLTQVRDQGDPQRRASVRLVLDGLAADASGQSERANGRYDYALQLDPTNPYVYLAVGRHRAVGTDPVSALAFIDRAEALLRAEGAYSPRVEAHLVGLRGAVWYSSGQVEAGARALERARELAPDVWRDGELSADELR